ncbi:MAG: acyl-CoA dehydrogenase family protein [Acetobacteraceae bacterium]
MITAANTSFGLYPGLTHGACQAILSHGSDALKQRYLPKMVAGTWSGTMVPDGSALRHRSRPAAHEGGAAAGWAGYRITGSKIFISAGEHDLTENIIHLVLARLPDAPPGVKGISLFLVPKFLPDDQGGPGARNGVVCTRHRAQDGHPCLRHLQMSFDDATGWLIGEPNRGAAGDVHHDEQRAPVGRHPGPRRGERAGLSGRGVLRQGPPAGPLAVRREGGPTSRRTRSSSTRTCAAC